jgi:hypothetical protein
VKILVYSASGDPLFVRDEHGHDFEVETDWVTDARLRDWATDHETKWNEIWSKVYRARAEPIFSTAPARQHVVAPDPLLVKAAFRILTTHGLPPLEDRDAHERRARALRRLGGSAPDDEVVTRREDTAQREWDRQHPKARPSHPSIWIDPWTEQLFPEIRQFVSDQQVFASGQWKPVPGALTHWMKVQSAQFSNIGTGSSPQSIVPAAAPVDPAQARREEAMRRLQDPPPDDFDSSVQQDIKFMLDGIRKRPVW